MVNYYNILQVSENCNQNEVKQAYRRLSMYWHPDKNNSKNATEMFININEAYNILIDPNKRKIYDSMFFRTKTFVSPINNTTFEDPFKSEKEYAVKNSKLSYDDFLSLLNRELGKAVKSAPKVIATVWLVVFVIVMLGLLLGLIKTK